MRARGVSGANKSTRPLKSSNIIQLAIQSFQNVPFSTKESKTVEDGKNNISLSIFPQRGKSILISLQAGSRRVKWTGVTVTIKPKGDSKSEGLSADMDERGQAVIKNVAEGEYFFRLW